MHLFEDPPVDPNCDLREVLFAKSEWYARLTAPRDGDEDIAAWRLAKCTENAWWVKLINAAFEFARDHGLIGHYRKLFAGIRASDLTARRADAEGRSVVGPIWDIANELVVARYLERVHGWRYLSREPVGRHLRRGDWLFATPTAREVFVEVKSIAERDWNGAASGVYMRPDYRPQLRAVLKGAYSQLPADGRATLVVLVGHEKLSIPHGVMHGDLFAALFGKMQISFPVGADFSSTKLKYGPSFYDRFVQHAKHTRLGCVAGLAVGGLAIPRLQHYAIHNPWAHESVRLASRDLHDARQFVVDEGGQAAEAPGISADDVWAKMR